MFRNLSCLLQGKWVLPALKQLLHIAKVIAKNSYHKAEKVMNEFVLLWL